MADNPYRPPATFSNRRFIETAFPGAEILRSAFLTGSLAGLLLGAIAATLIAMMIGYQLIPAPDYIGGMANTSDLIVESTLVSMVTGSILGSIGCCIWCVAIAIALNLNLAPRTQNLMLVLGTTGVAMIGAISGLLESILLTGSGIAGSPVWIAPLLAGAFIGAVLGSAAGHVTSKKMASHLETESS